VTVPVIEYWTCVGCGACVELCPEVFEMRDDKAWVRNYEAFRAAGCGKVVHMCPVGAISIEET
jgi:ferredoxin